MSVFGSAAQGLQSGLDFALRSDQARRAQVQTEFENTRQLGQDERAAADLKIRQDREARAADTGAVGTKLKALTDRQSELAGFAAAASDAGRPVNPAHTAEYDQNEKAAASLRKRLLGTDAITAAPPATLTGPQGLSPAAQTGNQQADPAVAPGAPEAPDLAVVKQQGLDLVSKLTAGQLPLSSVKPADLYKAFTVTTGMKPEQLPMLKEGADDVTAGIQTGNKGLIVQGANKLMSPRLMIGVGTPSPHGGVIMKKEIIGLDPMPPGPNGQSDPSKFIPRLRVITDLTDDMGVPLFYDAPMSVGGGTDDAPMVIDIKKGMDNIGNMGVLAATAAHPEIASALAEGRKTAEPEMDKYLSGLQLAGMAKQKVGTDQQWINTVHKYARENGTSVADAVKELQAMGLHQGVGVGAATIRAKIQLIDEMDISDEEKDRLKKALVDPIKPMTPLQQTQIEINKAKLAGSLPMKGAPRGYAAGGAGGGSGGAKTFTKENQHLTGDELLATLDPATAAAVKSIANGNDPKGFSSKADRRGMLEALASQYAQGYTSKTYPTAAATEKAFSVGVEGRKVRSFNVAIDHFDTLQGLADALKNGNVRLINQWGNKFAAETGQAAPTNFEAARDLVADELVAGIVPGVGALQDREKAAQSIRNSQSPDQFKGVIGTYQKLLGGQLGGLEQQYHAGGGAKDFRASFLTPRAREIAGQVSKAPAAPTGTPRAPVAPPAGFVVMK